jgi:CheY-like chemotaxis protein
MAEERRDVRIMPLRGEPKSILLVDDEAIILSSVSKVLKVLGFEVTAAGGGPEALELFSAHPEGFDLVITDHTMPGMTGIELAERLRDIRPDIPLILCSGFSDAVDRKRFAGIGISELLPKPADMQEIGEAVERALRKGQEGGPG